MKKRIPDSFAKEGTDKVLHYMNVMLEDLRSEIKAVIEYVDGKFDRFAEDLRSDMRSMEDRLTLRIGAVEFAIHKVHAKDEEQDRKIATITARLA